MIGGAVTVVAILIIALAVASGIFIQRFDAIETAQTLNKSEQVLRALETDLNQLALSTRDYGEWDDAQDYVQNRDPAFLRANFSADSLDGMQVDAMAIFDADGSTLYAAELNEAGTELVPPSPELIEPLRALSKDREELRKLNSTRRIVGTRRGPLAFSAVEIRRSDKSAATGATLVFARLVGEDEMKRVRLTSQLPVELLVLGGHATDKSKQLPPTIQRWVNVAGRASRTQTVTENADFITGYGLVRDVAGKPALLMVTRNQREIATIGRNTTAWLMGAIAGLLLLCGGGLIALMLRLRDSWASHEQIASRHRNILSHLEETIVLADRATGRFVEANQALLSALDYERSDLHHLTLRSVYADLPEELPMRNQGESELLECRMRARDGRLVEAEITLTPVVENGRELVCVVGRDLSLRKAADARLLESESKLARVAEHDELMDLPNRLSLQRRLPSLLESAALHGEELVLVHMDIDHFKNVNDSRGHGFGDRVLKTIAGRLQAACGPENLLIRMGGDEFILVYADQPSAPEVRARAERLLDSVAQPVTVDDTTLSLTASVGIASYPQDGLDADSLLKHADIALYEAKKSGRNAFRWFSNDMNVQLGEHVALEQALRRALTTEQIYVDFQPVVDLQTGLLVSFEALARWKHPDLGQVPPGRFIPVAEKSGLIVQLGEQMVRTVILQLHQWQQAGVPIAPVAINVAPMQFERTSFSNFVHELCLQHDVDPSWLAFEVTESAWLQDSSKHIVTIDTLRHAGSRVYIDDFGTGFSNLSYLKSLPVDAVKIDQAFVRTIDTDERDAAIVNGIITMANNLKLNTIAEGVETAAQAEKLREMGCQYCQGYYFSKPIAAAHCRALLEQLGETRQFTETVKIRAFRAVKTA